MANKDYNEGYQSAIEAIKQALKGGGQGSDQGTPLPKGAKPVPVQSNSQQKKGQNGQSDQSKNQPNNSQDGAGGGQQNSNNRDADPSYGENVGDARNEPIPVNPGLDKVPETPGGMIDEKTADDIVKSEGYESNAESVDRATTTIENKVKNSMGSAPGALKSVLQKIFYKGSDWKKELKRVIGRSLNPYDKRSAYANKNTLVSQDRIARTDKDKFDNIDFIMCCIDSSGSVTDKELQYILSEIYAMALQIKPITLVVVQCDTRIQDVKIYNDIRSLKRDVIHAEVKGRGGTDFKDCWDFLKTDPRVKRKNCEVFIIFTDGECPQYPRDRRAMQNLCWCIFDNPGFETAYKDKFTWKVNIDTKNIK